MKTPILEANNLNKLSTYGGFFGEWKALYFEEILTFCRRENSPWRYDFVLRNKEKEKKKAFKKSPANFNSPRNFVSIYNVECEYKCCL